MLWLSSDLDCVYIWDEGLRKESRGVPLLIWAISFHGVAGSYRRAPMLPSRAQQSWSWQIRTHLHVLLSNPLQLPLNYLPAVPCLRTGSTHR